MSEEIKTVKPEENSTPEADAAPEAVEAVKTPEIPAVPEEKTETVPEVPAEDADEAAKQAAKVKAAAIDEMEKASQKALEAMREEDNAKSEEIVDEAQEKLDDIFKSLRSWMETNTNPEKIKATLETAGKDVTKVLKDTKEKVVEVANSEQFKSTMSAGKDFIVGTGTMIGDGLKYGYDKLMEVPEFKKVAGKVDEGVDKLRHSDTLKDFVDHTEKGINDLNNAIFAGLRSFFETKAPEVKPAEEVKEEAPAEDKAE